LTAHRARIVSRSAVLLALAIGLPGCSLDDLERTCAARQHFPTPVSPANQQQLEQIKDAVTDAAIQDPTMKINLVDGDETTGTVVVGTSVRTVALCDHLHQQFGAVAPRHRPGAGALLSRTEAYRCWSARHSSSRIA
jgi:hypothetical protein